MPENPPALPLQLSRPDAQQVVDHLNIRTWKVEKGEGLKAEVITTEKIVKEAITTEKIKAEAVEAGQIKAGTITAAQIKAESITTALLAAEVVTAAKIKTETIEAGQIKAGTITAAKLNVEKLSAISANLGEVTAGTIIGNTIKTAKEGARVEIDSSGIRGINAAAKTKFHFDTATGILTAEAVISAEEGSSIPTKVLAGQIKETQIENEAISTPLLKANAVTAAKISVGELSAISANLGTITAGTITGATFRTSAANPKVQMDAEGIRAFDSGGNASVTLSATGEGLDLLASTVESPPNDRQIRWMQGAVVEGSVYTYATSAEKGKGVTALTVAANKGAEREDGRIVLEAFAPSVPAAKLRLGATSALRTVTAIAGTTERLIVNSAEESAFLQLPSVAKRKFIAGSVEVEWPGANIASNQKEVAHGLGTTPVAVIAISGAFAGSYCEVGSLGATTFKVRGVSTTGEPVAGTKRFVYWMAYG